jgi:hypothetical protein
LHGCCFLLWSHFKLIHNFHIIWGKKRKVYCVARGKFGAPS